MYFGGEYVFRAFEPYSPVGHLVLFRSIKTGEMFEKIG
jgi:hypothetical protein